MQPTGRVKDLGRPEQRAEHDARAVEAEAGARDAGLEHLGAPGQARGHGQLIAQSHREVMRIPVVLPAGEPEVSDPLRQVAAASTTFS